MNNRRLALIGLALSLAGFGVGYAMTNSTLFNFCIPDEYACRELFNQIGDPLFYAMSALAIVFLALIFFPKAFPYWKKFAVWFIPLAAIIFIFYEGPASGDLFSPYAAYVFKWVAAVYVVVSLGIIGFVAMRHSSQK